MLLEKAENGDSRVGLLRFIAAFSTHMSPRGLDIDVRHILVLVLLVGRLDDPDCMLRCTAAQLLIGAYLCLLQLLFPSYTHILIGPTSPLSNYLGTTSC